MENSKQSSSSKSEENNVSTNKEKNVSNNLHVVLLECLEKNANNVFLPQKIIHNSRFWLSIGYLACIVVVFFIVFECQKDITLLIVEKSTNIVIFTILVFLITTIAVLVMPLICILKSSSSKNDTIGNELPYKFLQHLINTVSDIEKKDNTNNFDLKSMQEKIKELDETIKKQELGEIKKQAEKVNGLEKKIEELTKQIAGLERKTSSVEKVDNCKDFSIYLNRVFDVMTELSKNNSVTNVTYK